MSDYPDGRPVQIGVKPRNFGITRTIALVVTAIATIIAVMGISVAVLAFGLEDRSTPVIVSVLTSMAGTIAGAIGALKATESADSAAKATQVGHLSASMTAAIRQEIRSHIGQVCTHPNCPFRKGEL